MARARNIKPSFFQNEELAELDPLARLFFIGLWTVADYKGCVEFRPKRLKVQLLPYDDCDTESLAKNLEDSGFVLIYSVAGKRYLKVVNFEKHQNPHKNERDGGSEIPDIDKAESQVIENKGLQNNRDKNGTAQECDGIAPADSLFPLTDSLNPLPSNSARDAHPQVARKSRGSDVYTPEFEEAWTHYPSRPGNSKADAFKAWNARLKAGATAEQMASGTKRYAAYCAAEQIEPKFIKQAATFYGPGKHYLADWTPKTPQRDDRHRASYDRTADNELMRRQMEALGIEPYDGEF